MATLIIGLTVAAVLFLAARKLYRDKKSGKSSCGGSCAGCPNGCMCHGGSKGIKSKAFLALRKPCQIRRKSGN